MEKDFVEILQRSSHINQIIFGIIFLGTLRNIIPLIVLSKTVFAQGRQTAGIEKRDKEYCEDNCISQATFELVNTTRSNIVGHLRAMGIVKSRGVNDMRDLNSNSKEWVFVKAALVGGLYPNLIFVDRLKNKLRRQ